MPEMPEDFAFQGFYSAYIVGEIVSLWSLGSWLPNKRIRTRTGLVFWFSFFGFLFVPIALFFSLFGRIFRKLPDNFVAKKNKKQNTKNK